MFIIQLMGGLGNQMFQYAAGRALSLERNINFCIDFDCPYKHIKYKYELDKFNINPQFATFRQLLYSKPKRKLTKRVYLLLGKNIDAKLVREKKNFSYDPSFFSVDDHSYLGGFWQTEKYFLKYENIIRNDFSFRVEADDVNREIISDMKQHNTVSVHIRRGDYVNFADTNSVHGVCSPEYYRKAIDIISEKVNEPHFYFFSDDIKWVEENLRFGDIKATYIGHNNGAKSYEDMRLMSHCNHNIIANSSFSWWGAWLNNNPGKIVIAPGKWINNPEITTTDLIPVGWMKI